MNQVILIGRLTQDWDVKVGKNGGTIANNTIAVPRDYKKDETDFIKIVAYGKTADFAVQYTGKGNRVSAVGSIRIDGVEAKDNPGKKNYYTSVPVNYFSPIDWKEKSQQNQQSIPQGNAYAGPGQQPGNFQQPGNYQQPPMGQNNYQQPPMGQSYQQNQNQPPQGNYQQNQGQPPQGNYQQDAQTQQYNGFSDMMPIDEGDIPF